MAAWRRIKVHIASWILACAIFVTPLQAKGVTLTSRISHAQVALWECQDEIGVEPTLPASEPWALPKPRVYRQWVLALWTSRKTQCLRVLHRRAKVVKIAKSELGTPYVWGGASPRGFDCSGLVMWAYAKLGISLPHYAASQVRRGRPVVGPLQPGDLVFRNSAGHVGIYIGDGQMIHSPHSGSHVKISPLNNIATARRII